VILTAPHCVDDDPMAVRAVFCPDGETASDIDAVSDAVGIPSNLMRAVLHRESAGIRGRSAGQARAG
jgi:hypothetical protein